MKEIHSNINIIGGGLIGAVCAYSLSKLDFKISILEKNPKYDLAKYNDFRTTAISEGTKNFFEKIGIWKEIKTYVEPIKKIHVIDRKLTNKLEFDNERRFSNLGYIIKNKYLLNVIYRKLRLRKNVNLFNNTIISDISFNDDKIITYLNKNIISADLLIAADGKKSFVKNTFKTPVFNKNYKKKALVINLLHSINHKGTAFEFFYKEGPLAILPMQKLNNTFISSIVWTNDNNYSEKLFNMQENQLISILNNKTQSCIGNIKKILNKQVFPLNAHLNTKFFEKRTIYVGDSAHSFHPIAGQGWNLGMNDVENLFNLIKKYKSLGIEIGNSLFCNQYHDENFYNAYRLYQITDKLDNFFKIQNPLLSFTRSAGIKLIQKNKKIRNIISDFAMGIN